MDMVAILHVGPIFLLADVAPDVTILAGGFVLISVCLALIGVAVAVLLAIKKSIVRSVPAGLTFHPAAPGDFPALDVNALEQYSSELETCGFSKLTCYTLTAEEGTVHPGFASLFWLQDRGVYAEVSQLFAAPKQIPMCVSLFTRFSNGWTAVTTGREADAAIWLLRRRDVCWRSEPGVSVAELLTRHLDLCHEIRSATGGVPVKSRALENWYDGERRNTAAMRATLERRNILVLLWEYSTYRKKKEWLGALKAARSNVRNDYN